MHLSIPLPERELEKLFYVSNKRLNQEYILWYENTAVALSEGIEEPGIPPFVSDSMMRIATRLSYKPNFINYTFRDEMIGDAILDCVRFARKFDPTKMLFKVVLVPISGRLKLKDIVVGKSSGYSGMIKYISNKTGKVSVQMYQGLDFIEGEIITSPNGSSIVDKIASHTADNPFSYITTICFNAFLRRIDKEKVQKYIKSQIVTESADQEFFDNQLHEEDKSYANQYIAFLKETGYSEDCVPMSIKRINAAKIAKNIPGPMDEFENE